MILKKWFDYFSYIIFSVILGFVFIFFSNSGGAIFEKMGDVGMWIRAAVYGLGFGIICVGIIYQKESWATNNEYPFKKIFLKFNYFKRKDEAYKKREQELKEKKKSKK